MRNRLYSGQKTKETKILLTEDCYKILVEASEKFGLEPAAYARSLIVTHLNRVKATTEASDV